MVQRKAIDPNLWGASAWHILHRLSFVFRSAKEARVFYESLLILLPCPKCRESFYEHLKKRPFPTNHKDIPEWCVQLHNMVNKSLGKEEFASSNMQQVQSIYSQPSDMEWTFIAALVDSHPGKRYITQEHTDALFAFLSSWTNSWVKVSRVSKDAIISRVELNKWLRKNNKSTVHFGVCSTNTCELRAGKYP